MKNISTIFLLLFAVSFGFTQTKSEKKALQKEKELKAYTKSKALIDSGVYHFEANWANTQKGRRINLTTNPNYVRVNQPEADIFLPYFGVVHSPVAGIKGDGGIVFKGKIENYKVEWNDKKQKAIIKFNANATSERLSFIITTFKSGNSTISVNSNIRDGISYDGNIKAPKNKE